jgi:hypothetical protein
MVSIENSLCWSAIIYASFYGSYSMGNGCFPPLPTLRRGKRFQDRRTPAI